MVIYSGLQFPFPLHQNSLLFIRGCIIIKTINGKVGWSMEKFFDADGNIMRALSRVADLAILNVLWLLCCIPVVTAGAATTALFYITLKMVKNEETYIVRSYLKAFKNNFKQSTIVWVVLLIIMLILGADGYIMCNWSSQLRYLMLTLVIGAALVVLFIGLYIFPLIAKFENKVLEYFKNAFLMSIRHLPYTILLVLIFAVQGYVCVYMLVNNQYLPLVLLFGGSAFVYVMSYIHIRVFKNYIAEEEM